jgi:3-carboxymuconate cyclase
MSSGQRFLVGTYTPPHGGGGGVHTLELTASGELRGGSVVAPCASPSFLAMHPRLPVLYSVAEHAAELAVHGLVGDAWLPMQPNLPAGAAACHVRVDSDGSAVTVACWGDGAVVRYALSEVGQVTGRWQAPAAEPTRPEARSRAHSTIAVPGGFVSTDLGLDLLRRWDTSGEEPIEVDRLALPAGSGPRHLVSLRPGVLFVDTEYSNEVLTVEVGGPTMALADRVPVRAAGKSDGDSAAEIGHSPSGRWLSVGVRGSDVIAVLRVDDAGGLHPHSEGPAGGSRPRHHLHVSGGILVAAQSADQVIHLAFDEDTGRVGPAVSRLSCPSPTHLLRVDEAP